MPAPHLNLEDFPNSAYAHELRRGLGSLRFGAALEAEYIDSHLHRVRLRVRVYFSLTLVLCLVYTFAQLRRAGPWNIDGLVHWAAMLPCAIALAWLSWSRQYQRLYLPAARALVPIVTGLIAAFTALGLSEGREEELAALTVNLFGAFFLAGLMFRQALLTSTVMLFSFTGVAAAVGLGSALYMRSMVVAVVVAVVAAVVYRDVEMSYRRQFLQGALIGELAIRDGMSGLMNRRAFDEHLLRVWQHGLREQCAIAVLMIDIDHFKQFNDGFGHQAGDVAIRSVAKVVNSFARRPLDLAARYGGEEFALILYGLELPMVQHIAQLLRDAAGQVEINSSSDGASGAATVTVSVGVGTAVPGIGRSPVGVVQLADEALYEAKHAGRNCVVMKGQDAYELLATGEFNASHRWRRRV
jgi:diguanylate cyclase (GGDEF)-like protein